MRNAPTWFSAVRDAKLRSEDGHLDVACLERSESKIL